MASDNHSPDDGGKLDSILAALQKSANKTVKYMIGTLIFYVVLIAAFIVLTVTADKPEARGANIGILILVSLGLLGMWISPLRGLKKTGVGIAGFLTLFHLPLKDRIEELKDASRWSGPRAVAPRRRVPGAPGRGGKRDEGLAQPLAQPCGDNSHRPAYLVGGGCLVGGVDQPVYRHGH